MTEITLPIRLQIELENSWAFGPEADPVTGEPAKPGTRYFVALKRELEERILADIPELGRPTVRGEYELASFDFNGAIHFSIQNVDLIAANAAILGSYERVWRTIAFSIEGVFRRGWTSASIALGTRPQTETVTPEDAFPWYERILKPRDIRVFLDMPLSENVSIEVQADLAPKAQNEEPSKRTGLAVWRSVILFGLVVAGALWFTIMQDERSRRTEERILQALEVQRTQPVQLNNEVIVNLPPAGEVLNASTSASPGTTASSECVRIIANGKEIACD